RRPGPRPRRRRAQCRPAVGVRSDSSSRASSPLKGPDYTGRRHARTWAMAPVVAMVGLAHPHSQMYLETLEAPDEVGGVVPVDEDGALARATAERVAKSVGAAADLEAALARADVTHALVALPNDRTPAALVRAIEAGKGVLTEKPGARTAAELEPVLTAL